MGESYEPGKPPGLMLLSACENRDEWVGYPVSIAFKPNGPIPIRDKGRCGSGVLDGYSDPCSLGTSMNGQLHRAIVK
ncbi:hypothetical protein [Zobellella maritima]|uniref:hypothetical protein n=1 Tax=Zobellella maritima TaxID=2059725 RepID=UPI000E30B359|nr:hypothetical protein [Zobellella maritima]